ncbi:MAG: FAD/NAD(P)-binding protein [Leucobacter sp.]
MRVLVVGGGVAGVAMARELVRKEVGDVTILTRESVATSPAFTDAPQWYLANTANSTMSLKVGEPDDYTIWLKETFFCSEADFAPRACFGNYLEQVWLDTVALAKKTGVKLEVIYGEMTSVRELDGLTCEVRLGDGNSFESDAVILLYWVRGTSFG